MSTPPLDPTIRDLMAGAYVLGTLTGEERAAVERLTAEDAEMRTAIAGWEARLAPLAELTPPIAPPEALWRRIAADTLGGEIAAAPAMSAAPTPVVDFAAAREARATRLQSSLRRWRLATLGFGGALATSLAVIGVYAPAYIEAQRDSGRYVGIVNTGGAMPALVVSVDTRRGELKIRPLGLKPEQGKAHELWAVRGNSAPVSLGLVDAPGARGLAGLPLDALADPALVLAVSVEPAGGSPTGKPTGPVVFTGKLIKED